MTTRLGSRAGAGSGTCWQVNLIGQRCAALYARARYRCRARWCATHTTWVCARFEGWLWCGGSRFCGWGQVSLSLVIAGSRDATLAHLAERALPRCQQCVSHVFDTRTQAAGRLFVNSQSARLFSIGVCHIFRSHAASRPSTPLLERLARFLLRRLAVQHAHRGMVVRAHDLDAHALGTHLKALAQHEAARALL